MLVKGMKFTMVGAAGLALSAGVALADNHSMVGLEYRAGLTYDDGKIHETDGNDAEDNTFTNIAAEAVKVTAAGDIAKDVSYNFRYNFLNPLASMDGLEHASSRLQVNKMMGLTIGRTKINQGGWHAKDNWMEYNTTETRCDDAGSIDACKADFAFAYANNQAWGAYGDVIGFHLALAGEMTVQFLNDSSKGGYNDDNNDPGITLEWVGNFGGWMPIVQISSYDNNHSQAFSLGVKGKAAGLGMAFGYNMDNRDNKSSDETDTLTGIDVHLDYAVGSWTPWIAYHSYDNKQGGTDAKVNGGATTTTENDDGTTTTTAVTTGAISTTSEDNAQVIALGVECNAMGDAYVPYASIISSSAKFADATGDEETRTGLALKVGVMGKF